MRPLPGDRAENAVGLRQPWVGTIRYHRFSPYAEEMGEDLSHRIGRSRNVFARMGMRPMTIFFSSERLELPRGKQAIEAPQAVSRAENFRPEAVMLHVD